MAVYEINTGRVIGVRSPMLYGHFLEHFHRQVYGGIYDPGNPLSDEDGFRTDIVEAMRRIRVPVIRWPGGCFVSSYHWKDGVGPKEDRQPVYDKSWRVEDPNTFGTDEFVKLCRKIGCEPYICTNAGTGTAEEMSDWVEYCNLPSAGKFAKQRAANGSPSPHAVRYWSIGNENYGSWEIGAKSSEEWGRLVEESAKMMKRVDPDIELSAAALTDLRWNLTLLERAGRLLDWISIHQYWDFMPQVQDPADYGACMAFTNSVGDAVREVRGLLSAMRLDKQIKIAFDEWNLRSWHHPNVHTVRQGRTPEEYITPRDKNDDNSVYTMADAVFSACFLNEMNRNCDVVGMANFSPVVNTRGCIYSHRDGIVLRSTYFVFELFTRIMGDTVLDLWSPDLPERMDVTAKDGRKTTSAVLDLCAAKDGEAVTVSAVNKHQTEAREITLKMPGVGGPVSLWTVNGPDADSYNDVGRTEVTLTCRDLGTTAGELTVRLDPHSVNVVKIG